MNVFEEISYHNYLSSGIHDITIPLNSHNRTMFTGLNGHGKSTMTSALTFALFGKDIRGINKANLVNSVNRRDCVVEVKFTANGTKYLVRRGIKPNIFEIYTIDSESGGMTLVDKLPDVKDYQQYLEKNILKANFKSFKQIVCLGSDSFVPFMKLSTPDRRDMIEDLLGLSIFADMNDLLKKKITALNGEISTHTSERDVADGKLTVLSEQKKAIEEKQNSDNQKVVDAIKTNEDELKSSAERLKKVNDKLNSVVEAIGIVEEQQQKLIALEYQRSRLATEIDNIENEIAFFHDKDSCPTCMQQINHDFKSNSIDSLNKKKQEKLDNLKVIEDEISSNTKDCSISQKLKQADQQLRDEVARLEKNITILGTNINNLRSQLQEVANSDLLAKINVGIASCKNQIDASEKKLKEIMYRKEVLISIQPLLKDTGIKSKIVAHYIPLMNQLINDYLQKMDFYVQFELDEQFNETIKSRYRDEFQYSNFSAGEKQRIDLAILFAWRHIARMRNSLSTNLLILDEVGDSSLDQEGVENLVKILNSFDKTNAIVITHNNETKEQIGADAVFEFTKKNNFTTVKQI